MTIRTTLITSGLIAAGLISGAAQAGLQPRDLNGSAGSFEAYYDADRNLTWLADANYAKTSAYDADGLMDWADAKDWAAGLSFTDGVNTYAGWRLPATSQPDASCSYQSGGISYGYGCSGSEMGHLFYSELGGTAGESILTSSDPDLDKFRNLQSNFYWSGSEYAPDTDNAGAFYFGNGSQGAGNKDGGYYAWAVRPGDVAAVPLPAAAWLLGSGLLGLIGVARRRR